MPKPTKSSKAKRLRSRIGRVRGLLCVQRLKPDSEQVQTALQVMHTNPSLELRTAAERVLIAALD